MKSKISKTQLVAALSIPPLAKQYYYLIPEKIKHRTTIGSCVQVNFANRNTWGHVTEIVKQSEVDSEFKLKFLLEHEHQHQSFDTKLLEFYQWISDYYTEPLANVIDTAVPKYSPPPKRKSRKAKEETVESDWAQKKVTLNKEQKKALQAISSASTEDKFQAFLLYGVTGSGKTEVYLEACKQVLNQGKSVLILVPEIALTPQFVDRMAARLERPYALLHSGLTTKQRWNYWKSLLSGELNLAVGVRSAVFAPLKNLGLVIVDEEHDNSYKQSDNLRYHARDLAVKRAQLNKCPIILGSATPTLETIYNVEKKKYKLLTLPKTYSTTSKNKIKTIDLNKCKKSLMASKNITLHLSEQIAERLKKKEQIFILYNRRGFASYLLCKKCNEAVSCPNCAITLTRHISGQMLCHYCGFQDKSPIDCPECQAQDSLSLHGAGTEKLHLELQNLFPEARLARLDRDSITKASHYRTVLDAVRKHEIDILLGTQMIAKGHDLPQVTLVGVIDCDVGLHLPDFRASEKIFQLLTQVAGRAGRSDKPGEVIFQTRQTKHPSIVYAKNHDYLGFVNQALHQRQLLNYPPFTKLLRIIASSTKEELPLLYLKQINQKVEELIKNQDLKIAKLGPTIPPIAKLRRHFRAHFVFKSKQLKDLQSIMQLFQKEKVKHKDLRITIDLDPQDLL